MFFFPIFIALKRLKYKTILVYNEIHSYLYINIIQIIMHHQAYHTYTLCPAFLRIASRWQVHIFKTSPTLCEHFSFLFLSIYFDKYPMFLDGNITIHRWAVSEFKIFNESSNRRTIKSSISISRSQKICTLDQWALALA